MPPRRDLARKTFGRLAVMECTLERYHGAVVWMCRCVCGVMIKVPSQSLLSGATRSCGCFAHETRVEIGKKRALGNGVAASNYLFYRYHHRARKRGLSFNLSLSDAIELFVSSCFYCGVEPGQTVDNYSSPFTYNGIDRRDNTKGYSKENCVPCCNICNRAKQILSEDAFRLWVKRVYDHLF